MMATISVQGSSYSANEASLVEKPPVAIVVMACASASKKPRPDMV